MIQNIVIFIQNITLPYVYDNIYACILQSILCLYFMSITESDL